MADPHAASSRTHAAFCTFADAPFPVVRLLDEAVHVVTRLQVLGYILSSLDAGRGGWVVTHNLDHIRRLKRDPAFSQLCAGASIRTADGAPLVWASRLRGTPLPERVAGSDLTPMLCEAAAAAGRSVFFLGGNPGTAERAAIAAKARWPGLRLAGTSCPPFGFEKNEDQYRETIEEVVRAKPDIVFVAIGSPKQELLAVRLLQELPSSWFLGVGISLSFLTGEVRRAPRWMQSMGLEWLHRLAQEPRRLGRRYLLDGLPFACRLIGVSLIDRFRSERK